MKQIICIITFLLISISSFAMQGDGSRENPFKINNLTDFITFRDTINSGYYTACAELNTDIDLKEICYKDSITGDQKHWFSIAGWGDGTSYQGRFDGKGHIIYNLYIESHIESNRGVFGNITNSIILNLGVENAHLIAGYNIGGIAGTASNSIISNCFVSGHIEGYFLGGIIGMADNCQISNCYSNCFVDGNYPGYIVGYNLNSTLTNCFYNKEIKCNGTAHNAIAISEESFFNGFLTEELNNYITYNGGDSLLGWCQTTEKKTLPLYHCSTENHVEKSEIETLYTNGNCLYLRINQAREIQIFDLQGRLYFSKKLSQGEHCIPRLPEGNYLLNGRIFRINYGD